MLATERVRGIMHQHTLPSSRALIQCNLFDCLMQMNGPDRPKSNLSHFSGLNKVWPGRSRSEEHTSELQSLMRISYAVFCLKNKKNKTLPHVYPSRGTK